MSISCTLRSSADTSLESLLNVELETSRCFLSTHIQRLTATFFVLSRADVCTEVIFVCNGSKMKASSFLLFVTLSAVIRQIEGKGFCRCFHVDATDAHHFYCFHLMYTLYNRPKTV